MATVVKTYALNIDRNGTLRGICGREVGDMKMTQADAGFELDRRVRRFAADHGLDQVKHYTVKHYTSILHRIIADAEAELVEAYTGARVRGEKEPTSPAEEVHERAEAYRVEHGVEYPEALRAILKADPELAEAYAS